MPGTIDSPATPATALAPALPHANAFDVLKQKVWLDINPLSASHSISGRTEIVVVPHSQDARVLKLNSRQARVTKLSSSLGKAPSLTYSPPYQRTTLAAQQSANQWHLVHGRLEGQFEAVPEPELLITFGKAKFPESKDGSIGQLETSLAEITIFIEFQMFSIGLRSGECASHSILSIPFCLWH